MYKQIYHRYRWYILVTVPLSMLLGAASVAVIAVISDAITSTGDQVDFGFSAFLIVILVLFVVGMTNDLLRAKLIVNVNYDIQVHMIRRVMITPLATLEKIGLPRVVATLTEDMEKAIKFFHILPALFVNLAICICGLGYMAYLSTELLLFVLAMVLVGVVTIGGLLLATRRDRVGLRELTDDIIEAYQQVVYGAKEMRLNSHRNNHFQGGVFGVAAFIRRRACRVLYILAVVEQWGQLLLFGFMGFVIFLVGSYISVSNEVMVVYIITLLFLLEPIEAVIGAADGMVEAKVAFNKIESLGLAEVDQTSKPTPDIVSDETINNSYLKLEARAVEFRYEGELGDDRDVFQLGPVSASFEQGNVTLVVGGNGSGKSTLLKVICGLYELSAGEVILDGQPLFSPKRQAGASNLFSMVSQDFCLFRDVLDSRGQICSDSKIQSVLGRLQLDKVVDVEKGRLESLDYSQGQKKRLALLQVYLEDRPIVLLDEWAADQDPQFKDIFYSEILPDLKRRGKIVIVISHDEKYFDCADSVIKLDDGQLLRARSEVA